MPYRIDLPEAGDAAIDRLIDLGALDVDWSAPGVVAALMPDHLIPEQVACTLGLSRFSVAPADGRDAQSVWVLRPRAIRAGRLRIVPAGAETDTDAIQLVDGAAFGTGLHPTTALCLEAMAAIVETMRPASVLDVGTGSGVLALAALKLGVPGAVAIDIDEQAVQVAAHNARLNRLGTRLKLACAGPEAVAGIWPLVLANILAAPLMQMAPSLVRRLGHRGRLVLSGIPCAVERDVERVYCRFGVHAMEISRRAGWAALVLQASW